MVPGSGSGSFLRIRFRTVRTWKRMGWTEGVDEGWLRIRNRIGSGFDKDKVIPHFSTCPVLREGGGGGGRTGG
jgi:hypothetical protein